MTRRNREGVKIDMFPFLSVLCSVIGVMMLFMLLIVSSRVIGDEDAAAMQVIPSTVDDQDENQGISSERYRALRGKIDVLTNQLAQRRREAAALSRRIEQFEDLVNQKSDEELVKVGGEGKMLGVELDKPENVEFIEDTSRTIKEAPRFVEVKANQFIVHPEKRVYDVNELDEDSSPLNTFLESIQKNRDKEYLLFLLHPNGSEAFQKIRVRLATKHEDVRLGWEPFSPGWLLVKQK